MVFSSILVYILYIINLYVCLFVISCSKVGFNNKMLNWFNFPMNLSRITVYFHAWYIRCCSHYFIFISNLTSSLESFDDNIFTNYIQVQLTFLEDYVEVKIV